MQLRRGLLALIAALSILSAPSIAQSPYPAGPPAPVPALPDSARFTTYTITGTTCACAVGFQLYGDGVDYQAWVEVWLNGVAVAYNDATFGWTITSPSGGLSTLPRPITNAVLTFNNAQTGTVQIVGARRPRRTAQFSENRGVAARDLNQAFTDAIATMRETWDRTNDLTGRAMLAPPGEVLGTLPKASARQSGLLGFDGSGNPLIISPKIGLGTVIGPNSSTDNALSCYSGTTGQIIKNCTAPTGTTPLTDTNDTVIPTEAWVHNFFVSIQNAACTLAPATCSTFFGYANVVWFGLVADSSSDNGAAWVTVNAWVSSHGGGVVLFPQANGVYCFYSGAATISSNTTTVMGAGRQVAIGTCNHDVTAFTLNGPYSRLENITIAGQGTSTTDTFGVTHPALLVNCDVGCVVKHVNAKGGSNPIQILGGGDNILEDTNSNFAYGSANIYIRAVSSGNVASGWLRRVKADDVYPTGAAPAGTPGTYTVNAWAGTTAVTLNEVRTLSGWYIQCTQSGTTGGGAPALQVYNKAMNDGSAKWQIVSQVGSYNIQFDSGSYQWSVEQTDISGPHTANLGITDTLNYSIKPGVIGFYSATTIGGGIDRAVDIKAGNGFTFDGATIGACVTTGCVGIFVNGAFGQVLTVANGLIYGGSIGIELAAGITTATKVKILGNNFYGWNQHAFIVGADLSDFDFAHNDCSNVSIYYGANADCYTVQAGTSDYYGIRSNLQHGVTGTDGGTGLNKDVSGNL